VPIECVLHRPVVIRSVNDARYSSRSAVITVISIQLHACLSIYSRATQPLQVGVYRYRLVDRGLPVIALIQRLRANIVDLLYLLRARYTCLTSERSSDGSVDISKKS